MICGGIYYCTLRRSSPNEVKRIWHLEPTLGETALEIALLIPDSCNDRVSCLRELATFLGLEGFDCGMWVVVWAGDELGPAFVGGAIQIPQRPKEQVVRVRKFLETCGIMPAKFPL
jgi:hypothetical protein